MVTYAEIQQIHRLEQKTPSLQNIPEKFYSEVQGLLKQVDEEEHRNAILKIAEEIYERRKSKILLHAIRSVDSEAKPPANIIPAEEELYSNMINLLKTHKAIVLSKEMPVLEGSISKKEEKKEKKNKEIPLKKIRMLRSIPSIVGVDLNYYGPLNENDVVEMPEENAVILIREEFAELA